MIIRSATKNDAEILTKIHQECFANYWNIDAFNDFFSVDATVALLASLSSGEDKEVGMMVYRIAHEQADIITIAVLPSYQRRGVAQALLTQALENIMSSGAKAIFLDVEDGNTAALHLYEKHGFSVLNRRKQYYRQKDGSFTDALVMMKKLS